MEMPTHVPYSAHVSFSHSLPKHSTLRSFWVLECGLVLLPGSRLSISWAENPDLIAAPCQVPSPVLRARETPGGEKGYEKVKKL